MDEITGTEETSAGRLSRRTAIKRIGTAGAIAWVAPVLTTVHTPAFAQVGSPPVDGECPSCAPTADPCPQPSCGVGVCTCLTDVSTGLCFCHQDSPCGLLEECAATSDCPDGWVCAASCCEGLRCLPPCGTFVEAGGFAATAESGTSTGR